MICKLCKKNEAAQALGSKEKEIPICNKCAIDIQLAFSWHIAGQECTRAEYEDKINGRNT